MIHGAGITVDQSQGLDRHHPLGIGQCWITRSFDEQIRRILPVK
jgi:hypothetical protein